MEPIPVIVPVFNRPEYTQVCLDSLYEADLGFSGPGVSILPIVVDNGSRPRTSRLIQAWIDRHSELPEKAANQVYKPIVTRIRRNRGFAAALNEGLRQAEKSAFAYEAVILHNDTMVMDGWLAPLYYCLEQEDDVAVVMPRTNYANEQSPCLKEPREAFEKIKPDNKQRISPEDVRGIVERTYPDGVQAFLETRKAVEPQFSYIPEVASFCMMFCRTLLENYPWFDEDFVLRTYEDKLWFLPMERDGFVCMTANRSFVHHFGNITSDGPGYSYPDGARMNEEKFKLKVRAMDEKVPQDPPDKAV